MPLNFTSVYVPLSFISALLGQDGAIMERSSHADRVPGVSGEIRRRADNGMKPIVGGYDTSELTHFEAHLTTARHRRGCRLSLPFPGNS